MTEQITDEETTTTPEAAVEAPVSDATTIEAQEGSQEPEERKGGKEARYRVERNEARTQRDALQARLDALQAGEVARLATGPGKLHDGTDLLAAATLADLLDDEGNVHGDLVQTAMAKLIATKPHLAQPAFEKGVGIGAKGASGSASWADVIAG